MYTRSSLVIFLFFAFLTANAQVFKTNFQKPIDLPFNLAGSFGEPRPDHFHSGIDIKTNGVEGYPVFAVGDGYISRIRVSPYGYGRAIYITHPNGYTSLYGHLSAFNAAIEKYIHQKHYQSQQSELDLTIPFTIFPVQQGDTIAFSGNTGGSTAPHLHFEVRDSKTEHALDPLDFYPQEFYVDTIPPQLNKIKVYQFNDNFYDAYTEIFELKNIDGLLTTENPILIKGYDNYCFSLEGFDKQDTSENRNGIYKMEVFKNNEDAIEYTMNEIDFDKTRMCNAFVDYNEMENDSGYFYNCYQLQNNFLNIYAPAKFRYFTIGANDTAAINIYCYDVNSNMTSIYLRIQRDGFTTPQVPATLQDGTTHKIDIASYDSIRYKNFEISFTKNTFYDDLSLVLETIPDLRDEAYSVYNTKSIIALQKPAKIEFTSDIKKNRDKVVIVRLDNTGKETALKTTSDKTKFYADAKELGAFYLKYDSIRPVFQMIEIKANAIHAKITDELSGIESYNGYIDNHWVNFYYDAKNDLLTYSFDEFCPPGEHNLKIVITDAVGNIGTFTQHFKN